jgi:hypothetical protein
MKRWLQATMVLILVLCILVIVVSPYVDLPLTTVRSCMAALLLVQILLLGGIWKRPLLRLIGTSLGRAEKAPPGQQAPAERLHWLCAYLC